MQSSQIYLSFLYHINHIFKLTPDIIYYMEGEKWLLVKLKNEQLLNGKKKK